MHFDVSKCLNNLVVYYFCGNTNFKENHSNEKNNCFYSNARPRDAVFSANEYYNL